MERNPYAPTKGALAIAPTIADEQLLAGEALLASRSRRLTNFVIDFGGCLALSQIVWIICLLINASIFLRLLSSAGVYVFDALIFIVYYLASESLTGRTLGKLVTRTRVVSWAGGGGGRPTFGQVLGRTLLRLVPLEQLTFFARGPGLHDRTSNTRVVLIRNA
jgi:uncharacterized RDD family membrane protein YckC